MLWHLLTRPGDFVLLCSISGHAQVQEAEALYKMCISDANFRQQELEKVRARIISHIRKLIYQGDEVLTWVCVVSVSPPILISGKLLFGIRLLDSSPFHC